MASAAVDTKDSATSANIPIEVVDAGTAPSAITTGHAARQTAALGDGGGAANFAGVDTANRLYVFPKDLVNSAVALTLTGALGTVAAGPYTSSGHNVAYIQMTSGSSTANMKFQGTVDGTNWVDLYMYQISGVNPVGVSQVNSFGFVIGNIYRSYIGGFQQVRLAVASTGTQVSPVAAIILSSTLDSHNTETVLMSDFGVRVAQASNALAVSLRDGSGSVVNASNNALGVHLRDSVGQLLAINAGTAVGYVVPVQNEPIRGTFTACYTGLAAAFAGDLVVLTGSASKTIRVRKILISGTASTAATVDLSLVKRSTADSAGTTVASSTVANMDSNDVAATATTTGYSAAPTLGTSAGVIRIWKEQFLTGATFNEVYEIIFGNGSDKSPVLRGATQQIALNFGAALTGGSVDVTIVWTEE